MAQLPPIRSWLYVPGNMPQRIEKAFVAGADAVILDLEDAVPDAEKKDARRIVASAVDRRAARAGPAVFVRVNAIGDPRSDADIVAVVRPGLAGLRLPKCEDPAAIVRAGVRVAAAERTSGLADASVSLVCGIESARGLWKAAEIAAADPRVVALAFGAADFARDLRLEPGPDRTETLYARSRLVIASRVSGLRPPIESVYTDIADTEGLGRTTREARALGFFGRSTIHPTQVPIVNDIFTPGADELARAREIVDAAGRSAAVGQGALRLPTGEFVDAAVVRRAWDTLRLAEELAGARS